MPTDFAPHNMTSNSAPSPYVASASSNSASLLPYMAFDGGLGTLHYWVTNSTQTGWLKLDIGAGNSKLLGSYGVAVNTIPEPNRAPKAWTIEGSNDNSNWDVLDTVTNQTGWGSGETRTFNCDVASTSYRYFMINVSENNGDAYLEVGELYLYEYELPPCYLHARRDRLNMKGVSTQNAQA